MNTSDKVLEKALPIYCDYINSFVPADETDSHYRPIDYTDDRANGHYGYTQLELHVPSKNVDPDLYIYRVSIGDEGGPALLYVWVNDETIVHMVHMFDTGLSNVAHTDGITNELIVHLGNKEYF